MEVSNQVIKVLDYAGQKFGIALDWTNTNVLPYVTELCERIIQYKMFKAGALMVISLIIMLVMWGIANYFNKKALRLRKEGFSISACDCEILRNVLIGFSVVPILLGLTQIFVMIQVRFLPEITIIQFLQSIQM